MLVDVDLSRPSDTVRWEPARDGALPAHPRPLTGRSGGSEPPTEWSGCLLKGRDIKISDSIPKGRSRSLQ